MLRYLASIRFTILLLIVTAVAVITGTVIESVTDSHAHASLWIYSNPAFLVLLAGFFVNILLSALRRWPWRRAHTPFLLAHLGLLMVLSGAILKVLIGVQGQLVILEGSGSDRLLIPNSRALYVDGETVPFKPRMEVAGLTIEVLELAPHSSDQLELWVKESFAQLEDLPPLPFGEERPILMPNGELWKVSADHVADLREGVAERYLAARGPHLWLLRDQSGNQVVCGRDREGELDLVTFEPDKPHSVYAVDGGRGGYLVRALIHGTTLYAPVTHRITPLESLAKLEENRPRATLRISDGKHAEIVQLAYDPTASALRWPALGRLLRFQPLEQQIPYRVRLHDARQINYPGTDQPKAYEASVSVNGVAAKLAMNKVYQTWDGYRFYLSNLTPGDETEAQRVQIVVNRDPAKYALTYPGGLFVSLGILLLYRKRGR